MATSSGIYVGIDVSKEKLDVAVQGEKQEHRVNNNESGIMELVEQMQTLEPELIVVEATGDGQVGPIAKDEISSIAEADAP